MTISQALPKTPTLVQATSVVMIATLAASAFGLVREALVAAYFGATVTTDAYFFAFDLIASLPEFLLSAIGACLIPVYLRSKQQGSSATFVSTLMNVYGLILLAVAVVTVVAAPQIATWLAAGFTVEGQQLISTLLRLLAPAMVLIGVWGILKTLLNAEGNFFVSTFSQVLQSVGIILAVLLLAPQLGIFGLPVGILVAAVFQVLWTGYFVWQKGFRYKALIDAKDPLFRYYIVLLVPSLIGALFGYIEPIFDKALASHLAEGTIAALSFAGRPMAILTRIAVYSFVTALLPLLSWQNVQGDKEGFKRDVLRILNMLMYVLIPLSLLLVILRVPIVEILFERGKFEASATAMTANIFAGFVIGLFPMAVSSTLSAVFIAQEDTRTPAIWGAGSSTIAKIVLSLLLVVPLGAVGLALATSLKSLVAAVLLLFQLRIRLEGIGGWYLLKAFSRILGMSLVAVSPVWFVTTRFVLSPFVSIALGSLIAMTLYAAVAILLQTPEVKIIKEYFPRLRRAQK